MLDIKKDKYIILELIPNSSNSKTGSIIQIQALKLDGLTLKDRFDYRINLDLIDIPDLKNLVSYDIDSFKYTNSSNELMKLFNDFIEDYPLLIIDNSYTKDYLKDINNPQESIFKYLNLSFSNDIFDILIKKYNLIPSNHLVDLLYESLIYESNN